ncbi:MAG: aldehyde ferredoxin oxidoreductase family protein [Euryarchaeota archaeon]|nr:aldehyde ferredoxin oxidoreductase family protein [Euryarchaeota archaeon]
MLKKLLVVDLGKQTFKSQEIDPADARAYIGGSGLGAKLLYDWGNYGVDPLSPDNTLLFMPGPLTASGAPDTGRHVVCFKSPLTGCWGEANAGGDWGSWLRFSGWDALAIRGRAPRWTRLTIAGDTVEFHSAEDLVGKDTYQTQEVLNNKDLDLRTCCIGPAGENLVKVSAIISEDGRAAARGGPGAVMGSKRLKAITCRKVQTRVPVSDRARFMELCKASYAHMKKAPTFKIFQELGTDGYMEMAEMFGDVSIKYFTEGKFAGAKKVSGAAMKETILAHNEACHSCPIRCARVVEVESGPFAIPGGETAGPEYETAATFGPLCANDNLEAVAHANWLCNRYGMDTISAGVVVAFSLYLYEKGLITREQAGRELPWGDPHAIPYLLDLMAHRRGLGGILAEGVRHMGKHYGHPEWAAHVKGMEIPMHDARAFFSMASEYATSSRGACHLYGSPFEVELGTGVPEWEMKPMNRFLDPGKGILTARAQDYMAVYNTIVLCQFAKPSVQQIADLLTAGTGVPHTIPDLKLTGERINNLKRAYNIRAGLTARDDTLPKIVMTPLPSGGTAKKTKNPDGTTTVAGQLPNLELQLKEFYEWRKWDPATGKPTREKLLQLGMEKVARDLWDGKATA